MTVARAPCGLFGKVPQQGDFVQLHLPEAFTEAWYAWLQAGLSVTREQMGEQWLDYYLTSPVWRFALSPGVCCERAVTGVMIPSLDEVGRYFPLTVAAVGDQRPWPALLSGGPWFDAVERVALSALADNVRYTDLVESLQALPEPAFLSLPCFRSTTLAGARPVAWVVDQVRGVPIQHAALGLLHAAYGRLLGDYSLWWTTGSDHVQPCLLIAAGLPEPGKMAAMLDGDWHHWGWPQEHIISENTEEPSP